MRLVDSPPGIPLEHFSGEVRFSAAAAFGPGRRYWTATGTAIVTGEQLLLVMPAERDAPPRVVLAAALEDTSVRSRPWWSFGTGLSLKVGNQHFTVEPKPVYGSTVTPALIRRARRAAAELESALMERPLAASMDAERGRRPEDL
jgi:hypothetical protein